MIQRQISKTSMFQPKLGELVIRIVVTVLLIVVATPTFSQGPKSSPASPVVVAEVYEAEVHPTQEFVGTVIPERRAMIGSAVDGRVAEYLVNEGDRVESGAVLAKLLDETITKEIEAAAAELAFREQELNELQSGSLPAEKMQAAAMLQIAEAEQDLANSAYRRTQRLYETRGASTASELDEAKAQFQVAIANIAERKAAKQLVDDGPRKERILRAQAQRDKQQAIVDKLKDQKKKHQMISRFAGYVVAEQTEEGEWVNRGDAVAEIVALDNVDVLVHVLESYVPHIQLGMKVDVRIPSLNFREGENPQTFSGTVARIIPEADSRSRTFPVKVRVKNIIDDDGPVIKSGMLARVELPVAGKALSLLVPKDALVLKESSRAVWRVNRSGDVGHGTVEQISVKTGLSSGSKIAVIEKLKVGDLVVVEGNERLRPAAQVKILKTVSH